MKIKEIRYPEGCTLKGWDKMVFERRVRQTLGSFFSICELDRCRADIAGLRHDAERHDELSVFHCEDFKNMSLADAQALVEKTAEYIGVDIITQPSTRTRSSVMAAMAGIVVGVAFALLVPLPTSEQIADKFRDVARLNGEHKLADRIADASLPTLAARMPLLPNIAANPESASEPIFTTTIKTDRPGTAARSLARTIRNERGSFEVSLTVTPVRPGYAD